MTLRLRFSSAFATLVILTILQSAAVASEPTQSTNQTHPKPAVKPAKNGKTSQVPPTAKKSVQQLHHASQAALHHNEPTGQGNPSDKPGHPAPPTANSMLAAKPNRAELTVLREEVHALRAEEAAVINNIRLTYDPLINTGHLSVAQLNQLRREIADQKYLAGNSADIDAIRRQYNFLDGVARGDVKRDNALIRRLKDEENILIKRVKKLYGAKIAHLEYEIRARGK